MINLFINDCYFNSLDQLKAYLVSATIESGSMQAAQIYDAVYTQDLRRWVEERDPDQTALIAALEQLDSGPVLPVSELLQRIVALITAQTEVHIRKPDFNDHAKLIGESEAQLDDTRKQFSIIKLRFQVLQPINESYDLALCDADGVVRSAVKQLSLDVDRGMGEVSVTFADVAAENDLWVQIDGVKTVEVYRLVRYQIGDYYDDGTKKGVVFEVDDSGRHGKIVSLKQSKDQLKWATAFVSTKYICAQSKTNGAANMDVVKQQPNWIADYPAFAWCASLGEGWYLPAIEELKRFTLDDRIRNVVNKTLKAHQAKQLSDTGWYWSSTEWDENRAWLVGMGDGNTRIRDNKFAGYSVRAVSAF